jgi:O-antigen ligase
LRKTAFWIASVAIFLVIFGLYPNNRSSILVKEFAYVAAGSMMAAVAALGILAGRETSARVDLPLAASFTALLGWMVFRHFAGVGSVNGPKVIYSFAGLGLFTGSAALFADRSWRDRILWVFLGGSMLLILYTVLQYANIILFAWDTYLGPSGRYSGALGNPNLLGSYLAASMPVFAAFIITRNMRKWAKTSALAATLALMTFCIIISGTRASLVGLGVGFAVFGAGALRRSALSRRALVIGGIAAAVCILAVAGSMRNRLAELSDTEEGTGRVRLVIWSGGLEMFGDNPFLGNGPGSFQILFPLYRDPFYSIKGVSHNTLHAHSEYIEILTDLGIAGLVLFGLLAWRLKRSSSGGGTDLVRLGLVAGTAGLLTEAAISVNLRWPPGAFQLALFVLLLLAGADWRPRRLGRAWAVPFAIAAVALPLLSFSDYYRSVQSGHMLFIGKDLMLDRIETELNLAGNAALAWEQTGDDMRRQEALSRYQQAWVLCDSSISRLQRCVEINPSELGGWYGLGSAWLSRAIVISPTSQPLMRLIAAQGYVPSRDSMMAATLRALQAYDSLAARAPYYAELHNNYALTYTRLGMPEELEHSLRIAWGIHAHRRGDYLHQVQTLSALGGWMDATHIQWQHLVEAGLDSDEGDQRRTDKREMMMLWFSGFAMAADPEKADSLAAAFGDVIAESGYPGSDRWRTLLRAQAAAVPGGIELFQRWQSGDTTGVLSEAEAAMGATDAPLPLQYLTSYGLMASRGDQAAVDSLLRFGNFLYYNAYTWLSRWPGRGTHLSTAISSILNHPGDPMWRPRLIDAVRLCLLADDAISSLVYVATSDFSAHVDPAVVDGLVSQWRMIGGPQVAYYEGLDSPWVAGTFVGDVLSGLDSMIVSDSTNAEYVLARLAIDYEMFSSFWWGVPEFSEEHRDMLLVIIQRDRRLLDEILGPEQARYSAGALMNQVEEMTGYLSAGDLAPFLERLRQDITANTLEQTMQLVNAGP